ncbi:MAG TPA: hypothetical protein VE007_05180 [Thermoanaerobaculia bacterium]|nr:hypothetical protein [Thermoanaerobaculia bacterium]
MLRPRRRGLAAGGFVALALGACAVALLAAVPAGDPLAAEISRWSGWLRDNNSTDENWTQVKQAVEPALARASKALQEGHRSLALLRFAGARANLAASKYVQGRPAAERTDIAKFEVEWARMGRVLAADMKQPSYRALEGVRPAVVRAIGEAAVPQVKILYDASADYARATGAESGLFYIGNAAAQREFIAFCRSLSARASAQKTPPLRSLSEDLDALETELLAEYRPPAAIDRHSEFIAASATLKEARELDAAGLRYGALLRYLMAAQRLGPLRATPTGPADDAALTASIAAFDARLAAAGDDESIGHLFVESAQSDLAEPQGKRATARATVAEVFPRYLAALGPSRAPARREEPRVTVTLVRWPYT